MGRLTLAWTLVIACALTSTLLLIALEAPSLGTAHLIARLLPVPDVKAADFNRDLAAAGKTKDPDKRRFMNDAERDAVAELQTAPMKPDAWLRLAYARVLLSGGVSANAAQAYAQSYAVAPIDPSIAAWRVHFGLESWPALSPSIRRSITGEMQAVWTGSPKKREALVKGVTSVADPTGRAAGEAVLTKAGWDPQQPT